MMKIIHTSDWHIGARLYERDCSADHRHMAGQIVELCREERPDALIIAGDIFDNDHPSASDQKLLAETIARLHAEVPEMMVVAVAGNHDSPSRHESHAAIYAGASTVMVGRLSDRDPDFPSRYIVDAGSGVIVAIPYYISRSTPIEGLMEAARAIARERPVVATGHTTMTGSDTTGHDARVIGLIDSIPVDSFLSPGSYDYLALGHIHRSQWIGRSGRVRYSGSPLPISFDEAYSHTVSIVEIDAAGAEPRVREVELIPLRPVVTLPAVGQWAPWDEVIVLLADFPNDIEAYLRLNVQLTDGPLPSTADDDARRASSGKLAEICHINVRRADSTADSDAAPGMTVDELRMASPSDVARLYAASVGAKLDEELFDEILKQLTNSLSSDDETA